MQHLPNDTLQHIFCYLNIMECGSMAHVCAWFRQTLNKFLQQFLQQDVHAFCVLVADACQFIPRTSKHVQQFLQAQSMPIFARMQQIIPALPMLCKNLAQNKNLYTHFEEPITHEQMQIAMSRAANKCDCKYELQLAQYMQTNLSVAQRSPQYFAWKLQLFGMIDYYYKIQCKVLQMEQMPSAQVIEEGCAHQICMEWFHSHSPLFFANANSNLKRVCAN